MTFLWDPNWVFVIGILFAALGHTFRKERSRSLVISFALGLFITTLLMVGAIWTFLEVDPEWMVNYLFVPTAETVVLSFIYPLFYGLGFLITSYLIRIRKDRFFYLIFAVWWIAFTLLVWDRFFLLYANTPSPEWWWECTQLIDNFLFIPTATYSLGPFFLFLTGLIFVFLGGMLFLGVYVAIQRKKCGTLGYENKIYCYVSE